MQQTLSITRKELDGYFSSLMALIFVGVFLAVTLFTFFWVDGFWGRGLADVRPLFRWMPLLMIFLVAALTMRQWSEEQQTGTLEVLLTMPVRIVQLVLGKFAGVLALVIVALLLTLFLPLTVSALGDLDWGPVVGGYLAAILMASAYIAIGLFVSSRTDNQIVALILTVLVCGLFHLIGAPAVTDLLPGSLADLMRGLSTSSRFESIERGVVDLRDLLYYLSLTVIFLMLNVLSLESKRWSVGDSTRSYRFNRTLTALLVALNIIAFNVLVSPVSFRMDLTADQRYTLSPVTRDLLANLQEPLLIRGYFSEENHPLLAPLVPQVRDMLDEYRAVGGDQIEVEIIDPIDAPDLEAEANQVYGIQPIALQTTDRSGRSVVNAYFDILVRYGDQNEVLNFQDLIAIEQYGNSFDIRLRDMEYDLTSSIKRVVFGFQSIDAVLAALDAPAKLTLYTTPDTLPEALKTTPETVAKVAGDIEAQAGGQFVFENIDVYGEGSPVTPDELAETYNIRPIMTLFSPDSYYLHMVLQIGDQAQVLYPGGDLSEAEIRSAIESGLKRMSSGFLQVVGIWTPPYVPQQDMFGQTISPLQQFYQISDVLSENYEVRTMDLSSGQVPPDIDVLLVIAPENMTDMERYAIDQYLMRGGSVFVADGNYKLVQQPDGQPGLALVEGGLREMLASYGVTVGETVVLDPQNEPFPVQVTRDAGGFAVTEVQLVDYPPFIDVRTDGMDRSSPILTGLSSVTMNWASPLTVDEDANAGREVTYLLKSTPNSWKTTSVSFLPDWDLYPVIGFPTEDTAQSYTLAVAVQGSFTSFFKDKELPFATEPTPTPTPTETAEEALPEMGPAPAGATETPTATEEPNILAAVGALEQSPDTTQLVVVGSLEFLNDTVLGISQNFSGERYINSLKLVQNSVDWFVEDTELASIRSRDAAIRVLNPLDESGELRWEIINYALAIVSVVVLGAIWQLRKRAEQPMDLVSPGQPKQPAA